MNSNLPKIQNQNLRMLALLSLSILFQSFSFLFVKFSSAHTGFTALLLFCVALSFIAFRTVTWQFVLRYGELTKVYPYSSLVQVLIFVYAIAIFGEQADISDVIGITLMTSGVFLISKG